MTGAIVTSSGDHYKGFHQCPNVLRDKYMPLIGGDGYGFVNYLLSWANTQATLSIRRMKKDLDWSQDKLQRVQGLVLTHCPGFVTMTPGDRISANQWHLDMEKLWLENAMHLAQSATERLAKRGVPEIGTPRQKARKGVPKVGTGGVPEIGAQGVPEIGTYKDIDLNTPRKTGGVLDVEGDARATTPVTPPAPVAEPSPAQPTTTGDAALQKDFEAVREVSASVAVSEPVEADPAEGISDAELENLFGTTSQASAESETVTGLEEVPAAGAGVAALAGLLAASEVPHDPEATRLVLTRALGGPARLATLLEEMPPGLREGTRHRWVSAITPERAQELVDQGRAQKGKHTWTAVAQLLDQEIGAQIKRGQGGTNGAAMAMPGAYATVEERAAQASALPVVTAGEVWYSRKSGKGYPVEEVTSQSVFVEGVGEYPHTKFHSLFRGKA